jgi:hypothetical protein
MPEEGQTKPFGRITAWVAGIGALVGAIVTLLTRADELPEKARALCETVSLCSPHAFASLPGRYHGFVKISMTEKGRTTQESLEGFDLQIKSISAKGDMAGSIVPASPGAPAYWRDTQGALHPTESFEIQGHAEGNKINFHWQKTDIVRGISVSVVMFYTGTFDDDMIEGKCNLSSYMWNQLLSVTETDVHCTTFEFHKA